jgi:hypothetical protein
MGYARRSVRRVTITGPGGAQSFDLSARGRVFLGVFAGVIEPRHFGAGLTMKNGTQKSFGLGSPMATYAADPDHGTPWTASGYRFVKGPRAGQTCVSVMREPPRFGPSPVEGGRRPVCADLSGPAYFFKVVHTRGRTMVVGAAGPTVTGVEVRAKGETRRAPLAARGRAFLAVFGANVRAYDLTVVIHKLHGTNMFSGQASMNLGFNRTRGPRTQFRVRPSEGTVTTAFSVWFVPPVPIDNQLDTYTVSFTGPGGPRCRELSTWQTGITWNPRYNARNARRGTSIGFSPRRSIQGSLIPKSSEPWCPGTFNGVLRFRDTPRTGGRSRARNLVHFRFSVRSDPGRDASQGLCPSMPFERVGVRDIAGLRSAVLDQVPQIYRGTNLEQMRIVRFVHAPRDRDRGGYARVKCGAKAWRRTYVAYLDFPAMRPSASLSQGVVLVGRFGGQYRIWARLH